LSLKKRSVICFIAGVVSGAALFGSLAAFAAGITTSPTTHRVFSDGIEVKAEGYIINGSNYFRLRDIVGVALDNSVVFDEAAGRVLIDTSRKYDPNEKYMPNTTSDSRQNPEEADGQKLMIAVGDTKFTATMADNSSTKALMELLSEKPLTIEMRDYGGFEKVGALGQTLPTNDERISTTAGDLILYQGNSFVIYYSTNSWNFTRLGKIDGATADDLKKTLGSGDVTVTLSVAE
jgi:hypothetical protein